MSIFRNFFDQFEAYREILFPDSFEGMLSEHLHSNFTDLEINDHGLLENLGFDPFDWVLGLNDGATDVMTPESSIDLASLDFYPETVPADLTETFYGEVSSSPAGQWLTGNEWSGTISSGTIDPTGQGNDVFAIDGEVISLPT